MPSRALDVFALGLISALVASALFNIGIALQGVEARAVPAAHSLQLSLLGILLQKPRWLLGLVLGIVGIGPQVLALALAPFVVVQTALAAGLLLLLVIGVRTFGERVGIAEIAGVLAIIGGVALVSWGAPAHAEKHRSGWDAVAVVAGLSFVGLIPFLVRKTRLDTGMVSIIASGCGFGATNVATKLMADDFGSHWLAALAWAIVGLGMGIAATITGMTAFQRALATTVVPISTAVQIFLPTLLEPVFLREHWIDAAHASAPIAAGLLLALVGSILVARTRSVSELSARAS